MDHAANQYLKLKSCTSYSFKISLFRIISSHLKAKIHKYIYSQVDISILLVSPRSIWIPDSMLSHLSFVTNIQISVLRL